MAIYFSDKPTPPAKERHPRRFSAVNPVLLVSVPTFVLLSLATEGAPFLALFPDADSGMPMFIALDTGMELGVGGIFAVLLMLWIGSAYAGDSTVRQVLLCIGAFAATFALVGALFFSVFLGGLKH